MADSAAVHNATTGGGVAADHQRMDDELDGGLPPGGVPEQQACDCGPCPWCEEERGMSSPCGLGLGHGGDHVCAYGDHWEHAGAGAAPQRKYCGGPCPEPGCGKTCTRKFLHEPPHMCPLGHTW